MFYGGDDLHEDGELTMIVIYTSLSPHPGVVGGGIGGGVDSPSACSHDVVLVVHQSTSMPSLLYNNRSSRLVCMKSRFIQEDNTR